MLFMSKVRVKQNMIQVITRLIKPFLSLLMWFCPDFKRYLTHLCDGVLLDYGNDALVLRRTGTFLWHWLENGFYCAKRLRS